MADKDKPAPANPKLPNLSNGRNAAWSSSSESEKPKEIPIAARLKGPGPAAYKLPSTIGINAKTMKRAPAYSFGIKLRYEQPNPHETPGPNVFFPQTTRVGRSQGPAFSLQGGYKKARKDGMDNLTDADTPGPGKYNPAYIPSREPKAPAYSIGGRRPTERPNDNPGPAEYAVAPTLGVHPAITIRAAAAYTIKPPRPVKLESVSPGPAAYSPLDPSKIKTAAPAYSLGSRPRGDSDGPFGGAGEILEGQTAAGNALHTVTPGPGQYTPDVKFSKSAKPQFSFRCKHSEYELFVPDTVDGEYIF
ncbi:uncharacterized protein SPPG_02556 [Spizellomyces punctatus DAOM BR117]|uniref:Outer dense fiber protein 3 n=1 Tax=Spizellomyces punctatus (strain DAOM BR117) TaxID=645134 RepID=A0A0L0HLR2_SPIPD|nr:uncharacterized protein SPPG_02556 [Spizellomyces punctatus DAOM BR117]KND02052.1 hypothetical protein SPPG_02556 [Spizellomyces punctatus DAOM BR117]|eukprot:XP_016610091.1 hypothetical protein SPPG_02556 [Spizellomyces punctatus DAOM BR117]